MRSGDIILSTSNTFFGKAVVFLMNLCQKDVVVYSHVSIAKDEHTIIQAYQEIEERSFEEASSKWVRYKIIRKTDLSIEQRDKMVEMGMKLVGMKYGISRLIMQVFDNMLNTNWFTDTFTNKKSQICSSLVAWIYYVHCNKLRFNQVRWLSCEPDDIDDNFSQMPHEWILIEQKENR